MYFTVINGLLLAFFLCLILIGLKLKLWAYLPINVVGVIIATVSLYLDLSALLNPTNIIILLATLVIVFISNIVFTFREFKEEITEFEAKRLSKYLTEGTSNEHFKLIRDEKLVKVEIDEHKNIPIQDRLQAMEMFKLANKAFSNSQYKEALEKYDLSTNWVETSIGYLNQSGVLLKLGQYEDALVIAQKAEESQPHFYEALLNQGVALEKLKNYDSALSKYKLASSIAPDDYEIWFCCANILFKMNKTEEAIEYYDKAINLYGRLFEAWYYKGVCLQKIGQEVEALHCYEQVINLKSNYSPAYYRSGNILMKLERNHDAIHAYEKAIKINPEFITAWNNLGVVLTKVGRVKDAIKCYDRAIKINPEYFEAWLNMGLAQDSLGMHKKAYVSYHKFLEFAPPEVEKRINITRKRIEEIKSKYKLKSPTGPKKDIKEKKQSREPQFTE